MRFETSHHRISLRDHLGRLNTDTFLSLLKASDGGTNGKKRASPSDSVAQGRRKRAKRFPSVDREHDAENEATTAQSRAVPAYRHVLDIEFDTALYGSLDDDEEQTDEDIEDVWEVQKRQEDRLIIWLREHCTGHLMRTLDLGEMSLQASKCKGRSREVTLEVCTPHPDRLFLLNLPHVYDDFDVGGHDVRLPYLADPLVAYAALHAVGRADMSTHVYVDVHEEELECAESALLPFRLRVEIEVSLLCPAIFAPVLSLGRGRSSDVQEAQRRVLLHMFPLETPPPETFREAIDIPLLYSILGPAPRLTLSQEELMQPEGLLPTLLPFQRRSVAWMLARENKVLTELGAVVQSTQSESEQLPLFWEEVGADVEEKWYINRLRGVVSPTKPREEAAALGGILAEEPGLGKTLECIALLMLNPSIGRTPSNKRWDPDAKVYVKEIKTTLIVTPVSLAQQWADELALHAPSLRVLVYEGWAKVPVPITEADVARGREDKLQKSEKPNRRSAGAAGRKANPTKGRPTWGREGRHSRARTTPMTERKVTDLEAMDIDDHEEVENEEDVVMDWCTYVNAFDVCITTYAVLQHDLTVARPPLTRPRRAIAQYSTTERARSPLVMCEWYRVIMDEVQMVGGGKAEEMVSLIPRLSSFAVSGTPARAQVADLIHVMRFLRVGAVTGAPRVWTRLLLPPYANEFAALFRHYAIRTVKTDVKDELTIPPQTRFLVPIELGGVERHVYDQAFESALIELELDARGVAVREGWEADIAVLRSWLRRIRGICTHPQVGQLQQHADRIHKAGVLKTMADVLEDMTDQSWRTLMEDCRNKVHAMSVLAQLQQRMEEESNRYTLALKTLIKAEEEAKALIVEVEKALVEHAQKGEILKADTAKLRESRGQRTSGSADVLDEEGKGKAPATSELDDDGLPRTRVGEEHAAKKSALQLRLRECRIVLHRVQFLKGDVCSVLHDNKEYEAYGEAEELRRLLLRGTEEAAARAMTQLRRNAEVNALKKSELIIEVPYCDKGGIKSHELMTEANEIIEVLLNEQSTLLWSWRTKLIALLTQPLTSTDEPADGQEYARSLETQGEAEAYLQAYAALLADRREALTSERTLLATHDVREAHVRHTKAAQKAAGVMLEEIIHIEQLELDEHSAVHQVLQQTLNDERKALLEEFDMTRALKSVMVDLNNNAARIHKEDDPEKIIAREGARRLRVLIGDQGKLMERLQADLAHLRKAFNERVSYFRQLQEISDTVVDPSWQGNIVDAVTNAQTELAKLDTKIAAGRTHLRYLDELNSREETQDSKENHYCIICHCEFTRGYLTQCGHVSCESCLKEWFAREKSKPCPMCREKIDPNQLQRFALKRSKTTEQTPAPPRISNNGAIPRSRRQISYSVIDPALFEDIESMESSGSYGSKVQTLIRHLLYLQLTEPDAKSIVFSAWADSLLIIQHALNRNGIGCLRIDQKVGKHNAAKRFSTDPDISVLLLHGERENAGLNVTCASRVFLVESVVHHAFEVQAIARIDRMGQTRPTEVYCYYAEDTVERNILDLAAKQGQSLYTQDNSAGTLNVMPFAMAPGKNVVDSPAKKTQKGDFVFKMEDMLQIFFPHMFEDPEYLFDPEDLGQAGHEMGDRNPEPTIHFPQQATNAVAGPSRLAL